MPNFKPTDFRYYDFHCRASSDDIGLIFPGWRPGDERVVVISPHDDDAALGAGYLILSALANGGDVCVMIVCDGWAGYSTPAEAATIVQRRAQETLNSYGYLGLSRDKIIRLGYRDFSVLPYLAWHLESGKTGTVANVVPALRRLRATRLLIPNGYREHIDHDAAHRIGAFDGPQVGDAILAEYGSAPPVRSFLQYAVWADLSPEEALLTKQDVRIRANRGVVAVDGVEQAVMEALRRFQSQGKVIEGLVDARAGRKRRDGWLEVYLAFDPRPILDYEPYHRLLDEMG